MAPTKPTAAATMSLSGPLALQGRHAAAGLELWAADRGIDLEIVDDGGSPSAAADAYRRWLDGGVDLLLGPYGSGLVRRVTPLVSGHGQMLWNHGGSADDLAAPGVVTVPAPASGYFRGAVEAARTRGLSYVLVARGRGPFAAAVAAGARSRGEELDLAVLEVAMPDLGSAERSPASAVLVVGAFSEDVAAVERIRADADPGLLGCVAAGLPEFGRRLGAVAEGVIGPVQWLPRPSPPEVGPDGVEFSRRYREKHGKPPSYVAAQAAAAGYLAAEAHERRLRPEEVQGWRTSTLLGDFTLDGSWRQVGHSPLTIEWRGGRQVPVV
jgi:ABC-type branched-subunit amino acid transport system substrate-binding protein